MIGYNRQANIYAFSTNVFCYAAGQHDTGGLLTDDVTGYVKACQVRRQLSTDLVIVKACQGYVVRYTQTSTLAFQERANPEYIGCKKDGICLDLLANQ